MTAFEAAPLIKPPALRGVSDSTPGHFNLAVIYSELGMEEKAQAVVAAWQRLNPNVSVEAFRQFLPFKNPADVERHLNALRKAGLK